MVDEVLKRRSLLGGVALALWGRVVPATRGWRAQFAYPPPGVYLVTFGWDWWKPARLRREQMLDDLDLYGEAAFSMTRDEFIEQLTSPGLPW